TPQRIQIPGEPPELAGLRVARGELDALTKDPDVGARASALLSGALALLERAKASGAPSEAARATAEARREMETRVKPELLKQTLASALSALATAAGARRRAPSPPRGASIRRPRSRSSSSARSSRRASSSRAGATR